MTVSYFYTNFSHNILCVYDISFSKDFFAGYGVDQKCTNPMYTTTTSDYGWYPPSAHTAPYR